MKRKTIISGSIVIIIILLIIILMPKEEELYTKPVIEAYKNDEFEMAEVKKGDLIKKANINIQVQNFGEKQLYFTLDDFNYKGIYVKEGDYVEKGQLLAELSPSGKESLVADSSSLQLFAPDSARVTYVLETEEGEKSLANQYVVITNSYDFYVLSAFTPYWDYFKPGDTYTATLDGKEVVAKVIDPLELNIQLPAPSTGEGVSARVYYKIEDKDLLLYAGIPGNIEVTLDQKEDVLYIPSKAVTTVNDDIIVYVEDKDGIRSTKKVKTGLDTGSFIEITEGLSLGDKVILD